MVERISNEEKNSSSFIDDFDFLNLCNDLCFQNNQTSLTKTAKVKESSVGLESSCMSKKSIDKTELEKLNNQEQNQKHHQLKYQKLLSNLALLPQNNQRIYDSNEQINIQTFPTHFFSMPLSGYQFIYQPTIYHPIFPVSQPFYPINKVIADQQNQLYSKSLQPSFLFIKYIKSLPFGDNNKLFYEITTEEANKQIQFFLKSCLYDEVKYFLNYIINILPDLMKNNISNLYIQILFSLLHSKERLLVINSIKSKFVILSCSFYSTYCIQELIKTCKYSKEEQYIISLIVCEISKLSIDKLGNHVLQCIINQFKSSNTKDIESFMLNNLFNLSKNKYGISLIKVFIEVKGAENRKVKKSLINIILNYKLNFFTDEIAHYLILHILKTWNCNDYQKLLEYFIENFNHLLTNKYSQRILEEIISIFKSDKHVR